jgi:hypothetical protein
MVIGTTRSFHNEIKIDQLIFTRCLRANDGRKRELIVAHLNLANSDGGCGAISTDEDGYERGE